MGNRILEADYKSKARASLRGEIEDAKYKT